MISFTTPLLAGVLADVYLGRFRTVLLSYGMYILGVFVLFMTSLPALLSRGAGLPGLIVAMVFVSCGLGAIKATIPPYLAEQCSNVNEEIVILPSGERVFVSRPATIEYTFNLYYWSSNMGVLSRIASTYLEKNVGFWAAFLVGLSSLCLGVITLLVSRGRLIEVDRQVSAIIWAARALRIAVFKRLHIPISKNEDDRSVPGSDEYIQQLKSGLKVCHAFLPFVVYWLCQAQMGTNTVSQAANMQTHGIPNDLLSVIDAFTVIIVLPMLNHMLYPWLRKLGYSCSSITRIAVGLAFESCAMAWATGVQALIYTSPPCYSRPRACAASHNGALPNDVNVAFQLPAYVFEGIGESFALPAVYDYAFNNSHQNLKSIVQGIYVLSAAFGYGISLALSPTYKDPKLLYMYAGLAGSTMLVTIAFILAFRAH